MTLNKKRLFLVQILVLSVIALIAFGCAVPQKPTGGPRDVTPPKLLKATPANQTHNFSSKTITLDFDEYFKLQNQFQEITITPTLDPLPDYNYTKKPKSLIITFKDKDTLLKNTTYVINFGKAIADLHESNVLKNFSYVFSTGNHIDSLSISGKVTNILTQDREKDVTVMLFTPKQDTALFGKKKATVYTTTDTAGNFTLSNLHEGVYKLYALKEKTVNRIYDEGELIGIPNKIINLQVDTNNVQLKLFPPIPETFRLLQPRFDPDGKISLIFNKPLEKPGVRIIYPPAQNLDKYVEISKTRDTALLYIKNMDFDSLRVAIFDGKDSVYAQSFHKGRKETFARIVSVTTNADARLILKPGTDLSITANTPLTDIAQPLIVLMEDSTILSDYTIKQDTSNLKHFTISNKWKQNANYTLTFNENALMGYWGEKNKKIIKKFKIEKPENYCQLTLSVILPDTSRYYIVNLLTEQNKLLQATLIKESKQIIFKSILSGRYRVSVVYDDNKNGKWDTGDIKTNRQPENIWIDRVVHSLRATWENEVEVIVPPESNL